MIWYDKYLDNDKWKELEIKILEIKNVDYSLLSKKLWDPLLVREITY